MLSLYSEIIVSILGASLLGLFAGWMIQKALANRKLAATVATWEDRLIEAEDNAKRDSEHLEDQLQSLGDEVKSLTDTNRSLKNTLQDNESVVHQARTDAMELNRQQAETQERLQRIIQEKEQKLSELGDQLRDGHPGAAAMVAGAAATIAAASVIDNEFARDSNNDTYSDSNSDSNSNPDNDRNRSSLGNEATAAVAPQDEREPHSDHEQSLLDETAVAGFEDGLTVSNVDQTEALDSQIQQLIEAEADLTETVAFPGTMSDTLEDTARLGTTSSHPVVGTLPDDPYDATLDATADDLADDSLAMEEATVAMDDDALRFARTPRRRD